MSAQAAPDQWERMYVRCSALVRAVARRATVSPDGIDDLCHNILVRYLSQPECFRGGNLDAWFVRVAQNAAKDLYRRQLTDRKRWERVAAVDHYIDVEEACVLQLERGSLEAALDQLPSAQRQLVELAFLSGYTHLEIADVLGLPLGTVKTRIRSALRRLRTILSFTQEKTQLTNVYGGHYPNELDRRAV